MNDSEELEMLRQYVQEHAHPLDFAQFKKDWLETHPPVVVSLPIDSPVEIVSTPHRTRKPKFTVSSTEIC
jgi:hypothetical protein